MHACMGGGRTESEDWLVLEGSLVRSFLSTLLSAKSQLFLS